MAKGKPSTPASRKLKAQLPAAKTKSKVNPKVGLLLVDKSVPKKVKAELARVLAPPEALNGTVLDQLGATVLSRRTADPAFSHSARLLSRGTAKVAQKFGEEAVECLIEAVAGNREALVAESADVLYHLIVLWVDAGIAPTEVWEELHRREGISGIAEKARRKITLSTTKIP